MTDLIAGGILLAIVWWGLGCGRPKTDPCRRCYAADAAEWCREFCDTYKRYKDLME